MADDVSDEHAELRSTVRRFLADVAPEARVRALMESETAHDPTIWKRLTNELGLAGLAIPAAYGGSGFGLRELGIVSEELGRTLLPSPLLAGLLASAAVIATGDAEAAERYLPGIAAGTTLATLAVNVGGAGEAGTRPSAVWGGTNWQLNGQQRLVLDAHVADLLIVLADTADGPGLYAVDPSTGGVQVDIEPGLDRSRRLTRVTFDDARAQLVGDPAVALAAVAHALRLGTVVLAAEQVGGGDRLLSMTRDYALTRYQFGRAIGSFQVVKHMIADMLMEVELARSAYLEAVHVLDCYNPSSGSDEASVAASVAKVSCSTAYFAVAAATIQVHGGIGFTWEHPAHLYFKRATSDRILFGSPGFHREQIAAVLGI